MCNYIIICELNLGFSQYMCNYILICELNLGFYQYMCKCILICELNLGFYQYMCNYILICFLKNLDSCLIVSVDDFKKSVLDYTNEVMKKKFINNRTSSTKPNKVPAVIIPDAGNL